MKVFFGLLLIVNIAFGVFQWLLPYEQMFVESREIPLAEELQFLSEPGEQIISETEVVAAAEARIEAKVEAEAVGETGTETETQAETGVTEVKTDILVVEDTIKKQLCYTIGPFKDKTRAIEVSGRYTAKAVETRLKSSLEKEYLGVMIYIKGHKSRDEARRTADKLAAKGIRDSIIINEPGKSNILSLGVFGLKKNADRHRKRIEKLNYKVESEARYRARTIYWLYNKQSSESELLNLLDDTDTGQGISQISSQCA